MIVLLIGLAFKMIAIILFSVLFVCKVGMWLDDFYKWCNIQYKRLETGFNNLWRNK